MRPNESFIGQPVRSLQTMLRVIGEDAGQNLTVIPDGIYGPTTQAQVAQFQQQRGLPVTGVANQETWDRIVREYPDALTRVGPAEPVRIILNPGRVIRRGEQSHFVLLSQAILKALSDIYGSITMPSMNGILDTITANSISSFQYLSALPETGEIDKITWKHLALQYPLAVNFRETNNRTRR